MKQPLRQRGAAALTVTLLLLFVLTLVVGFASRNLLFEQRSSANQARSTQAFEAAEAGLAWAQAMLDSATPLDADCEPSTAPGDTSLRDRFLAYDTATARFTPRTWNNAGTATPLSAACVLTDTGWSCSCPSAAHPALTAPPATGTHPAFELHFVAAPRSGMVFLLATGCDHYAPACLPGMAGAASGGATARAQVLLGLLPALATVPVAALTARGDIAASAALALANTAPGGGGLTAQAAGSIAMPLAGLATLPGTAVEASLAAADSQLGGTDAEHLLTRFLGLDRNRWQQLPNVQRLDCPADCGAALTQAIGPAAVSRLAWIDGDLNLDGPLAFGSAEHPVVLVVDGQLRLSGGVIVHGVVLTLAANWDTSGTANASIHGAVIALGHVSGNGTPAITYDAAVLARLHGEFGSFVRVPGSWRDF